jgi:hypothetical protein
MPMMPPMGMGGAPGPATVEPSDASGLIGKDATLFTTETSAEDAEVAPTAGTPSGGAGLLNNAATLGGMPLMPGLVQLPPSAPVPVPTATPPAGQPTAAAGTDTRASATAPSGATPPAGTTEPAEARSTDGAAISAGAAAAADAATHAGDGTGSGAPAGTALDGRPATVLGTPATTAPPGSSGLAGADRVPVPARVESWEDIAAWGAASAGSLLTYGFPGARPTARTGDPVPGHPVSTEDDVWSEVEEASDLDPGLTVWKPATRVPPVPEADGGAQSERAALGLRLRPGPPPEPEPEPEPEPQQDTADADEQPSGPDSPTTAASLLTQDPALWGRWDNDSRPLE